MRLWLLMTRNAFTIASTVRLRKVGRVVSSLIELGSTPRSICAETSLMTSAFNEQVIACLSSHWMPTSHGWKRPVQLPGT